MNINNNTQQQQPHLIASTPSVEGFSIPVKICDGLFMADRHISQDVQFFQTNLISHVINCVGQEVVNCRKIADVAFLTFDWSESTIQNITQQKVVSVTVNFIEECRRNAGCLLIHYSESQSRPFCLLACYFMIKFKWSLFKTLEFLNSRKEDVELEPAFFQQLTFFSQKLQEKGLIRSKTWNIVPGMADEELVITNTYCNSKNKHTNTDQAINRKKSNLLTNHRTANSIKNKIGNDLSWKKQLVTEYVYNPNIAICQLLPEKQKPSASNMTRNNRNNSDYIKNTASTANPANINKQRSRSNDNTTTNPALRQKQNNKNTHNPTTTSSASEINVTKKWAELREMWLREKENYQNTNPTQTVKQNSNNNNTALSKKQGQRINDRLQDKLDMLKKHEQRVVNSMSGTRISNERQPPAKTIPATNGSKKRERPSSQKQKAHKEKEGEKQSTVEANSHADRYILSLQQQHVNNKENKQNNRKQINNSHTNTAKNSRVVHNNWIIDSHHIMTDITNNPNISTTPSTNPTNNQAANNQSSNKASKSKLSSNNQKSVIIVKPNHIHNNNSLQRDGNYGNNNSRSSLRKVTSSERKQDKINNSQSNHEGIGKFFRNEVADIMSTKGRSNSAKPQRKEKQMNVVAMTAMGLSKNGSLKGKGKWKL